MIQHLIIFSKILIFWAFIIILIVQKHYFSDFYPVKISAISKLFIALSLLLKLLQYYLNFYITILLVQHNYFQICISPNFYITYFSKKPLFWCMNFLFLTNFLKATLRENTILRDYNSNNNKINRYINAQLNINKLIRFEMNLNVIFNICLHLYTFPILQFYKFNNLFYI